jgi:hypothetical protein
MYTWGAKRDTPWPPASSFESITAFAVSPLSLRDPSSSGRLHARPWRDRAFQVSSDVQGSNDMTSNRCRPTPIRTCLVLGRLFGGAVALVVSVAPSDRAIATDEDIREIVEILDENGDGLVDRDEFLRQKTVIFSRAISDRRPDQGVSPEEINITSEAFAAADLNDDGKLSGGEFVQAPFTRFEAIDANSDQKITFEELRDFLQRYRPGG